MRSTRFNSFCDIVESLIHISPRWLRGLGYHQSLLLTKFIQLTNSDFDNIEMFVIGSCRQLFKKRSVFTCSITICSRICRCNRRCRCSRSWHNACADEDFSHYFFWIYNFNKVNEKTKMKRFLRMIHSWIKWMVHSGSCLVVYFNGFQIPDGYFLWYKWSLALWDSCLFS